VRADIRQQVIGILHTPLNSKKHRFLLNMRDAAMTMIYRW